MNRSNLFLSIFLLPILFISCNHNIKELKDISVNTDEVKTTYLQNENIDYTGLVVTKIFEDDTSETTTDFTVSPEDGTELSECGTFTATVTSGDFSKSFEYTVVKSFDSLTVQNSIQTYYVGDIFNYKDLTVTANYSDGSTSKVDEYECTVTDGSELAESGAKTITITYAGKTADIEITVKELGLSIKETMPTYLSTVELYSEAIDNLQEMKVEATVQGHGTVTFDWYMANKNGSGKEKMISESFPIEDGKKYTSTQKPKASPYLQTEYYCVVTETNGTKKVEKSGEKVGLEQVMPDTGLPVLKIDTENYKIIDSKDNYLFSSFDLQAEGKLGGYENITLSVSIKGRGNSSWEMPKKSYTLKFDKKSTVLGMPKSKKWVLIANYSDKTLLRNLYSSYLGNEIFNNMEFNPTFKSVDFILNGEYVGNYIIGEQIKIEKDRVNIQSIEDTCKGQNKDEDLVDYNNDEIINYKDGGFIVEVNQRLDESFNFTTKNGVCISLKDPDVDGFEGYEIECEEYIKNIIQTAEDVLYGENFADPDNGYAKYIDVDSFIDWWFVNEISKNNDAIFFASVYMYYAPADGLIHMGPNWDFDISFGNINYNNCDKPEGWWIKNSKWISILFTDPVFVQKVKNRWNEIKSDLVLSVSEVNSTATTLDKSQKINFTRWNIIGNYVWPNPEEYENRTTYQSEVEYMKSWLLKRIEWIDNNIKLL